MADHQDAFGSYPDALNAALKHYNYSKPPVHGWALRYCMKKAPRFFAGRRLADLYGSIARWSEWWMKHRTLPGDRLPHYLHGNDSGWDNSTMFDSGAPLIAPDLGALLALQVEVLGDVAARLGRPREAGRWQRAAEGLRAALLERLWKGGRFIAIRAADGREVRCESLVPCMPLVLGKRLPADVRASLVRQVRAHLTPHGLATEPPWSPEYKSDGYWRGPIWAPSTLLVVDGLGAAGETRLARTVAARFCRLCAREGFAENFDALTGAGLRDRAYTWTSSVFLILASEYLGR
jgi:glycogen debranching enzyme